MSLRAGTSDSFRNVTSYLSWDHDRLSTLLADATLQVEASDFDEAARRFAEFDEGLARHMRIEEEILFPLFEARTGLVDGPTAALRAEHKEIVRAVTQMRVGVRRRDAAGFHEGLRFLRATLPGHNSKEEHILYPATDIVLSEPERMVLTERLQLR